MRSLSGAIADFYVEKNIIKKDMKSVYEYGVSLLINDIINFSMILLLSALLRDIKQGIIFLIVFYFTRVRCGGFHAKKVWICRTTMLSTFIFIFLAVKFSAQYYTTIWSLLISFVSIITLLPIVPVENPNKKLDKKTREKNRKVGILITCFFAILSIILSFCKIQVGAVISFTILSVAVLAVIGNIVNKQGGGQNE